MERINLTRTKDDGRIIIPRESEKEVRFDLMNHDGLFQGTIVYSSPAQVPRDAFKLLSEKEREYLFNNLFVVAGIE